MPAERYETELSCDFVMGRAPDLGHHHILPLVAGLASSFMGGGGGSGKEAAAPSGVQESGTRISDNRSTNVLAPAASLEGVATLLRSLNTGPSLLGGTPTAVTAGGHLVNGEAPAGISPTILIAAAAGVLVLVLVMKR